MPINKETIISVFDEKLTLMQWLKTINKALEDAVLTGVTINKKGNATLSFVFTFEDGTTLETDDLILQQGESINGATIRNGHLYLTLTNGDELDAGNVKPVTSFAINASQHLIVYYGDGTSQDLGTLADFSNADFVAKTLKQLNANYSLNFNMTSPYTLEVENIYNRFEEINNVLYCISNVKVTNTTNESITIPSTGVIAQSVVTLPISVAERLYNLEGKTLLEVPTALQACVAIERTNFSRNVNFTSIPTSSNDIIYGILQPQQARVVYVMFRTLSAIEVPANSSIYITARIALTLL